MIMQLTLISHNARTVEKNPFQRFLKSIHTSNLLLACYLPLKYILILYGSKRFIPARHNAHFNNLFHKKNREQSNSAPTALFAQFFKIFDSVICNFDPLRVHFSHLFKLVCSLNQIVVLVDFFFELSDPVIRQPGGCYHSE